MTAIELDVTGADQPEEAVSIDNTNSVNLMEQTVSTKVKFNQKTDVSVKPDNESTSQQADVTVNPIMNQLANRLIQQADVAVKPDTESTSNKLMLLTFNPEYDSRSKETVLLHQDDSIIQVIITTINPNDNSTTRQVDITDFTVEHNNTFTTGLADVNNITDQPDDQSTNEQLDELEFRMMTILVNMLMLVPLNATMWRAHFNRPILPMVK
ncbi:unnamed protein product [Mytilus coruscus]|uniref:Uncharacterized protein n=1 Tax=Mytilus coruscus TaxID=42192 RepID=A0A6J8DUW9_MYTCO|nr:unnamed protein product [Mytilus coruscus]